MAAIDLSKVYNYINSIYKPYLRDYRMFQIYKGGGSAGKSWFIAQKIIYNAIMLKGYNGLCLRKVAANNHQSTFAELLKCIYAWNLEAVFKINESKGAEEITCLSNGNQILFKGLDDVKKLKSITFRTGPLIWVWFEEADESEEEDLNHIIVRLRGKSKIKKQIYISFNPVDADHWLKKRFFDIPIAPRDGFTLSTTYNDNRFLEPEDRANLEAFKDHDYYFYRVYCLGEWGSIRNTTILSNVVVKDFDIIEHNFHNIRQGMDFGFVHAQSLNRSGWYDGDLYIYHELYGKRIVNKNFITMANKWGWRDYHIIADCADPGKITEWGDEGYGISGVKKQTGESRLRATFFQRINNIYIHATNCPNTAREFNRWKFRELKNGTVLEDPVEVNDDSIAAVSYGNREFFNDYSDEEYSPFGKRRAI